MGPTRCTLSATAAADEESMNTLRKIAYDIEDHPMTVLGFVIAIAVIMGYAALR